jgi:acetyl-CoA carboxylase biotin carboxyl carrier protein
MKKLPIAQKTARGKRPDADVLVDDGRAEQGIDVGTAEALARLMSSCELSEIELSRGGDRLRLVRGGQPLPPMPTHVAPLFTPVGVPTPPSIAGTPVVNAPPAPHPVVASSANGKSHNPGALADEGPTIVSPFVGTFYRSPSPEAPAFAEIGQRVKRGQVLCIVEAMKLMNEIEAEIDGVVAAVLVENGQSVEYGQPLFRLTP